MPIVKVALRSNGQDPTAPITLAIAGKCNGGCLGELRRAIDKARRTQRQIVIDMSEVTLVDKTSLQFLAAQSRDHVTLINCPPYIQPWISRENCPGNDGGRNDALRGDGLRKDGLRKEGA